MDQVKIKQMDTPLGGPAGFEASDRYKGQDQGELAVGGPGRPHEVKL